MSSPRPAETVPHLSDYLWWLLPAFLKQKARDESLVSALADSVGSELDDARATLTQLIPAFTAATAAGIYLDQQGRVRQVFRSPGESEESYRARILAAHEIKHLGGTTPGMVGGLAAIGYSVEVIEAFLNTDRWSHFIVRVLGWDGVVTDQLEFYRTVRKLKPAHTRAVIESELAEGLWDDWEEGAEPAPLDTPPSATLDDWTA